MNKQDIIIMAADFVERSEDNRVSEKIAISTEAIGLKMYEPPIFGFGDRDDPYFERLREPSVIGSHVLSPREWLPSAVTVISFFLPFTEEVRGSNQRENYWPSDEWLHARVEGQEFIHKLCTFLQSELIYAGYDSIVPSLDIRFWSRTDPYAENSFTSNWSERHAAFICGLGTFGLSKGLITARGMAGRFGSIIAELEIAPDKRNYQDTYEYCTMGGICAKRCPANAISIETGKNHKLCSQFVESTRDKYKPRLGCGKCQVGLPCEKKIPNIM
jgi:epoxyqueuosine reductase